MKNIIIVLLFAFPMNNIFSWWILFYFIAYLESSVLCFHSFSIPRDKWCSGGAFSLFHRLLGLDFPTNVQATCFGQTVSECSSANGLHSRDLDEDGGGSGGMCMHAHGWKKSKSKKSEIKSLTCRGGWTPLKLTKNYESFSTVIETSPDMVYNIWWKKVIVILILIIRQFRI